MMLETDTTQEGDQINSETTALDGQISAGSQHRSLTSVAKLEIDSNTSTIGHHRLTRARQISCMFSM